VLFIENIFYLFCVNNSVMDQKEKDFFAEAVYSIVREIPFGRVTSYGAIANAVGYPAMSRMVGRIVGCYNGKEELPFHRVVNSNGRLSGKMSFKHPMEMQERLESEHITVINDKIKDWKNLFWNPLTEISL
jgi:methylated-DNA-protein-cysteine methyltransferase-like protein